MATGCFISTGRSLEQAIERVTAIGGEDEVRAGIERYRDAGADSPCIGPAPTVDVEATLRAGAPGPR